MASVALLALLKDQLAHPLGHGHGLQGLQGLPRDTRAPDIGRRRNVPPMVTLSPNHVPNLDSTTVQCGILVYVLM